MTIHDNDTPLYRRSGVSIGAGDALVARLKSMVRSTHRKEVVAGVGGFGALFSVPNHYQEPVLVSGTDGVGTKLKVAFALDGHDSIGTDLVAMSVNDILAQGAEPLFFLDYFACGQLDMEIAARVVGGMVRGCEQAGCSLIGGETAEMPGMYPSGEYDIAGFAVGVVEKAAVIDGAAVQPGDSVIGLASNGLHANGYSLVRKIVEQHWGPLDLLWAQQTVPWAGGLSWREVLLVPTRIYVKSIRTLLQVLPVKAMAHITGGGLIGNLPRMLDKSLGVGLHRGSWPMLEVVSWLVDKAGMSDAERYRVFNCGIGMAVVVSSQRVAEALDCLAQCGEAAYVIGEIVSAATQFDTLKKEDGDRVVLL